ncbi:hypothetical protein LSH36_166g04066 [Paralvinella palmiformis]|uniref:Uncharacterized protein n=1 Tax=Paralvinella palmiformis TaxID=53620 RepID=A0AAD9N693_9ANNE|nr:hypothetical protein LSH36_166g04066 [Paralvinella palmiformis]
MFHEGMEGIYVRLKTSCIGRYVYKQSNGDNYLFYNNISGLWQGWMVGRIKCTESDGIRVETGSYYPENVKEAWQEWYFEHWYYSNLLELKCDRVNSTTLIGVTVLGLLILLIVAFTAMRCRAMMQRRRMAPQPVPRTQVSTVTSTTGTGPRLHNNAQHQPPYPGLRSPRPLRPHGPLRAPGAHLPPPPMRPGFGHGPMMPSGYGPNPRMPQYNPHPMAPPPYFGYNGPLAPGYPDAIGPPPPYKPPSGNYPDNDLGYPPSDGALIVQPRYPDQVEQQQQQLQSQQQEQQQQQVPLQQEQQSYHQQRVSEEQKQTVKGDDPDDSSRVRSVQSMTHGHGAVVENQVTADVAD